MKSIDKNINNFIKNLPSNPGIYQFKDRNDKLLYIGKAKNLKKRVQSYFYKNHTNYRLNILVNKIEKIEYIIVKTEQDALLLENNLIKEYQPRYNIQLKDDKTFPWICIKNERFPRVFTTRNRIEDNSSYFGPYTSAYMVRTLIDLIRKIYPLRTCNLNLSVQNVQQNKFRTCLEFQIKNCKGPCEGFQSEDEYNLVIENIKKILRGNLYEVIGYLKDLMNKFSNNYQFEEAENVKNKIEILEKFQSKTTIVNNDIKNLDVFSITSNDKFAVVNFLKINNGGIVQSHNLEIKKNMDESDEELLEYGIADIYQKIKSESKEVLISIMIDSNYIDKKLLVPKIGDKKHLVNLSLRNAKQYRLEIEKRNEVIKNKSHQIRILNTLMNDLRLKSLPYYIECFDNSNIQGYNAVSSCVVFRNAKPCKSEYRHFNVKTVEGPDDYSSMKEIVERRYKRLLNEHNQLPDLIIIDGGKGQLNAAYEILKKLKLHKKIPVIGIAKRLEEIYYPNDPVPLYLDKNSEALKVIQFARNEAHRFGIAHHRNKRNKELIESELDDIHGIGNKTKEILLKNFLSVDRIKALNISDLERVIGKIKAKKVYDHFSK